MGGNQHLDRGMGHELITCKEGVGRLMMGRNKYPDQMEAGDVLFTLLEGVGRLRAGGNQCPDQVLARRHGKTQDGWESISG